MTTSRAEIADVLRREGVVSRQRHPHLTSMITAMARSTELVRVLPGVFAAAGSELDPRIRVAAVATAYPDAVITGAAAASLSFWPQARVAEVTAALPGARVGGLGIRFERRRIPVDLLTEVSGIRLTVPALTALDMCTEDFTEPLDVALRTRVVTLALLRRTMELTAGRRGNRDRWKLVIDSRDGAWSFAERLAHRVLRQHGVTGWAANVPVRDLLGQLYYVDIGFARRRLGVEVDGRVHERDWQTFHSDRERQNRLLLSGWRLLRFTLPQLQQQPEMVAGTVLSALQQPCLPAVPPNPTLTALEPRNWASRGA